MILSTPLLVLPQNDRLSVVRNKKVEEMELPLLPFFYSDRRMTNSSQLVKRAIIPTRVERDLYLTQVPDIESYYFEKEKAKKSRIKFAPMNYLEQLFIEKREWATKYPQDSDLSIVYLDIEVLTRGEKRFPRAKTNPIISIGAALNEESPIFFGEYNSEVRDAVLLSRFLDWFKSVDPDLVITYNGEGFDIPYIVERAKLNGINATSFLNRINGDPLTGRVHFDLYHSAESDQSLFGIKSKSLKDVAEWFGHSVQRLGDPNNTEALIGSEELRNYQLSDVQLTRGVSKAYLPNAVALANLLKVPLGSVVNCWPSFIPKLLIARGCHKQGLVAIDNNLERYGDKDRKGSLFNFGTTKFEGAIVDCFKFGYINHINKVDFNSFYPNTIRTFNLGPDTTTLKSLSPYTGEIDSKFVGSKMYLNIPDKNIGKQLEIEVDHSKEGILKSQIESLMVERKRIKNDLDKEWNDNLNSRQMAIKVAMNCFSPDTEILLVDRISNIKDVKVGDIAHSINPTTLELEQKKVIRVFEYDAPKIMYSLSNSGVQHKVTGNHKFLTTRGFKEAHELEGKTFKIPNHSVKPQSLSESFYLTDYLDVNNYDFFIKHTEDLRLLKKTLNRYDIRKTQNRNGSYFNGSLTTDEIKKYESLGYEIYIRANRNAKTSLIPVKHNVYLFSGLIGMYISEGSLYSSIPKKYISTKRGMSKKVNISQYSIVNPTIHEYFTYIISEILNSAINCNPYITNKGISFSNDAIYEFLETYCGKGKNKYLHSRILSDFNLDEIFKCAFLGDGTKGLRLYSISKKYPFMLNSFFQLLINHGYSPTYRIDGDTYRVSWRDRPTKITNGTKKHDSDCAKVYCIEVEDNHTVYAGINGRFSWISQSIYGYIGSPYASYGDTTTSVAVTSLCRWASGKLIEKVKPILVEVDTDGAILDQPIDIKELNNFIEEEVKSKFGVESQLSLEQEPLIDGYFHKMKNYIVRKTKKGKIVVEKHGVKFKSSRQCKVADKLLDALTSKVFDSGSGMKNFSDDYQYEWAQEWLDLSRFDLDDFKFRLRFSKTLDQYADSLSLPRQLAIQAEDILGIDITDGLQLEYFVTNKPVKCDRYVGALVNANRWRKPYYTIAEEVKSIDELDLDYIRDQMAKYFEVFDWTYSSQRSLF